MSDVLAPVLVTVLDRQKHFSACISSLAECYLAKETDLYIAIDYPPSERYFEGYCRIKDRLNDIKGFKTVTIISRESNFGALKNLTSAMSEIFEKNEAVIVTEDDNEFSKDFLLFINSGLNFYKNNLEVFSVCGYGYPLNGMEIKSDVYLYDGFSAWGFGIWRDRYEDIEWNISGLNEFLLDNNRGIQVSSKVLLKNLNKIIKTNNILGDAYLCYHQIKNGMMSIFPVISRVRNNGHDGSGLHCEDSKEATELFTKQVLYEAELGYKYDVFFNANDTSIMKKNIDKILNPSKAYFYFKRPLLAIRKIVDFIKFMVNRK